MERALAPRDRANRLLDAYGALLTAQQRRLLASYYRDDLSLGEIAEQARVSRQAVHDGVRRAVLALERYEAALRLVDGSRGGGDGQGRAVGAAAGRGRAAGAGVTEHYFARAPSSRGRARTVTSTLRGRAWTFRTAGGVFAHRSVDPGTRLLIQAVRVGRADHVLDLGCGYGPIGLVTGRLASRGRAWLVDANVRAAALALANARANGVPNARVIVADGASAMRPGSMDVVVTNPPIRAGRQVVRGFVDGAWRALRPGGRFYLVARTAQGATTLGRLIAERFGEARQIAAAHGYRVYEAVRRVPAGTPADRTPDPQRMSRV